MAWYSDIQELTQEDIDRARRIERKLQGIWFARARAARDGEFCKCCGLHSSEGQLHYFGRAYYCEAHYPQAR